ncbi:MAG: hypothetical protein R2712_15730 [Vicinamibacterales bacterium]
MSKTQVKGQGSSSGTVADQVAEYIGRSMGELLNKKDALAKQMADVDAQIADIRSRVMKQFGGYLPGAPTKRGKPSRAARVRARARASARCPRNTRQDGGSRT